MWAAFDDLRHPTYLRKCVAALESRPEAVHCCTAIRFIDEKGRPVDPEQAPRVSPLAGETPRQCVQHLAGEICWYDIYGLARRDALEKSHLFQHFWGADVLLEMELSLLGPVIALPEPLFQYRIFLRKDRQQVAATLDDPNGSEGVRVSHGGMATGLVAIILGSRLPAAQRFHLAFLFAREFLVRNRVIRELVLKEFSDGSAALRPAKPIRGQIMASALVRSFVAAIRGSEDFWFWLSQQKLYGRLYWKLHAHSAGVVQRLPRPC